MCVWHNAQWDLYKMKLWKFREHYMHDIQGYINAMEIAVQGIGYRFYSTNHAMKHMPTYRCLSKRDVYFKFELHSSHTKGLVQYKDAILPAMETPLWR